MPVARQVWHPTGGEKAGRLGTLSNRSPGVVPVKSLSGTDVPAEFTL
jgi:hypothetical protein